MENASKALIIAGAILVSILLVGLGVALYNAATAPVDQAIGQSTDQAVQIFNAKFSTYAGTKQSGTNVRSLLSTIIANNANSNNETITVKYGEDADSVSEVAPGTLSTWIKTTTQYEVLLSDFTSSGYVSEIKILGSFNLPK